MRHFDWWSLWNVGWDIAMLAGTGYAGIWAWLRFRQAQSWPSAQGTIGSISIQANRSDYIKPWAVEFAYSYVVQGEYYSGRHVIRAWRERGAEELGVGWKGRMVVVRYSPKKHNVSVLLKTDQPGG